MTAQGAPQASDLALQFYEPLQLLQMKHFDYNLLSKQGGPAATASAVRPDFLSEVTYHRGAVCAWLQSLPRSGAAGTVIVPAAVLDGLAALAARLHGLAIAVATPPRAGGAAAAPAGEAGATAFAAAAAATAGLVRTEWTSALSGRPQRMLRLDTLPQELAMVYTTYAAALRHSAHQRLQGWAAAAGGAQGSAAMDEDAAVATSPGGGPDGDGGGIASALTAALTAAVGTLRRAAGVYAFLAEGLLTELGGGSGSAAAGDRPLELAPPAALCMQRLCLAEAQGLMAAAAACKGMSPATQRALHAGCASLFRQAEEAARELAAAAPPGLPSSDLLARLMAVSAALQTARAHHCRALELQREMELGAAEASCEECQRLLDAGTRCLGRSDPYNWAGCIKAQQAASALLLTSVRRDRMSVTYQALPKEPPDATANATVRVAADPFQPSPVPPPAPVAEEPARGGCAVM